MCGAFAVQEHEGRYTFDRDVQLAQVTEITQRALASGRENAISAFDANTGHAEQRFPVSTVDLYRRVGEMLARPEQFRVFSQGQIAVLRKGQFFNIKAIIPE